MPIPMTHDDCPKKDVLKDKVQWGYCMQMQLCTGHIPLLQEVADEIQNAIQADAKALQEHTPQACSTLRFCSEASNFNLLDQVLVLWKFEKIKGYANSKEVNLKGVIG